MNKNVNLLISLQDESRELTACFLDSKFIRRKILTIGPLVVRGWVSSWTHLIDRSRWLDVEEVPDQVLDSRNPRRATDELNTINSTPPQSWKEENDFLNENWRQRVRSYAPVDDSTYRFLRNLGLTGPWFFQGEERRPSQTWT